MRPRQKMSGPAGLCTAKQMLDFLRSVPSSLLDVHKGGWFSKEQIGLMVSICNALQSSSPGVPTRLPKEVQLWVQELLVGMNSSIVPLDTLPTARERALDQIAIFSFARQARLLVVGSHAWNAYMRGPFRTQYHTELDIVSGEMAKNHAHSLAGIVRRANPWERTVRVDYFGHTLRFSREVWKIHVAGRVVADVNQHVTDTLKTCKTHVWGSDGFLVPHMSALIKTSLSILQDEHSEYRWEKEKARLGMLWLAMKTDQVHIPDEDRPEVEEMFRTNFLLVGIVSELQGPCEHTGTQKTHTHSNTQTDGHNVQTHSNSQTDGRSNSQTDGRSNSQTHSNTQTDGHNVQTHSMQTHTTCTVNDKTVNIVRCACDPQVAELRSELEQLRSELALSQEQLQEYSSTKNELAAALLELKEVRDGLQATAASLVSTRTDLKDTQQKMEKLQTKTNKLEREQTSMFDLGKKTHKRRGKPATRVETHNQSC
jgi:hypothetical protein